MATPGKNVGAAMLLVGKPAKPAATDDSGDEAPLDASKVGEQAAARSLLSAVKADDVDGVKSALRAFLTACGALDGEPDADDEGTY